MEKSGNTPPIPPVQPGGDAELTQGAPEIHYIDAVQGPDGAWSDPTLPAAPMLPTAAPRPELSDKPAATKPEVLEGVVEDKDIAADAVEARTRWEEVVGAAYTAGRAAMRGADVVGRAAGGFESSGALDVVENWAAGKPGRVARVVGGAARVSRGAAAAHRAAWEAGVVGGDGTPAIEGGGPEQVEQPMSSREAARQAEEERLRKLYGEPVEGVPVDSEPGTTPPPYGGRSRERGGEEFLRETVAHGRRPGATAPEQAAADAAEDILNQKYSKRGEAPESATFETSAPTPEPAADETSVPPATPPPTGAPAPPPAPEPKARPTRGGRQPRTTEYRYPNTGRASVTETQSVEAWATYANDLVDDINALGIDHYFRGDPKHPLTDEQLMRRIIENHGYGDQMEFWIWSKMKNEELNREAAANGDPPIPFIEPGATPAAVISRGRSRYYAPPKPERYGSVPQKRNVHDLPPSTGDTYSPETPAPRRATTVPERTGAAIGDALGRPFRAIGGWLERRRLRAAQKREKAGVYRNSDNRLRIR